MPAKAKSRAHGKNKAKANGHAAGGPRAFWSGTITFGLVSVPVDLFPASRGRRIAMRMLDEDGTPVKRRFYCPEHNRDVRRDEIIRGYELEDGRYVVVTDEELESLEPRKTRDIELLRFVQREEIPPMLFERGYFLTPGGESTKAYHLLAEVMMSTRRVGIATFVLRDREYVIAIMADNGILRAQTLRFSDEVRSPENIGLAERPKTDKAAVAKFRGAIERHTARGLSTSELTDEYAELLRKLAEKKRRQGEDVVEVVEQDLDEEAPEADDPAVDLLEVIRRSLGQTRRLSATPPPRKERATRFRGEPSRSKDDWYDRARKLKIPGRSQMTKQELQRAVQRATAR